ncbi:MAG: outer membrane lipoprotein-sorting protein [Alphaproteobacteria bacterium]
MHRLPSLGAALLLAVAGGTAIAQTPEEKGRAIFEEMDRRDTGFGDSAATMTMILANRQGGESRRKLAIETLEGRGEAEGDKVLMVFDYPPDVRGTALLTYTKILEPDDQWLFMPAVKRVKRISSSNKAGPFLGSEFAYEDFLSQEVEKFKYRWLRDEACGELTCFVVERIPLYEGSGYMRQIVWLDQSEYRAIRIDYYDRRDEKTKTLTADDYRQHLDRFWRAARLTMENHQTGKSTVLEFDGYRFRVGLTEDRLSPERLGHLW